MKQKIINYGEKISQIYQKTCPEVIFQVTEKCNLNCSYCYEINKTNVSMSFDTAKKFIDLLLDNNENTKKYIDTRSTAGVILTFIGGEPLIEINLIEQIINYFRIQTILKDHPWQYNWMIDITTNGILYFNSNVQNFIKKYQNNLSFSISIDGNRELHDSCRKFPNGKGSYDLVIKAVRDYQKYNHYLGNKMTISPENINFLFDGIKNLIQENYKNIFFNCIYEKGWENFHGTILYNELKKITNFILANNLDTQIYLSIFEENFFHSKTISDTENWCGGNGRMIALDWKGDIYPCIRYMESSLGPNIKPIKVGNVYDGIMTNQDCISCINQLKQVNRITQSNKQCLECPIAEGCGWCQGYNYQDSGDFNHRATYICPMHKARSLANVYYWNLYYEKNNINKVFEMNLPKEDALNFIDEKEYNMLLDLVNSRKEKIKTL